MATIPNTQKILTSALDVNTTYGGPASLKELNTWYTMQDIIDTVGGPAPVLTTYPVTNAALAGERFWYKGNEWHYMTQAEIDSTGWTGLADVGFPALVTKVQNAVAIAPELSILITLAGTGIFTGQSSFLDFIGYGFPNKYDKISIANGIGSSTGVTITSFKNAKFLTALKNAGTTNALVLANLGLTNSVINDLFTQLPTTINTATIDVRLNPGSATCDPTIATAKGYTVVTT
jgi:hypothetical protein